MTAQEKLNLLTARDLHVCVGLDSDSEKIPAFLGKGVSSILDFNKIIIDSTKQYAAAYKLNLAFYEEHGPEGMEVLLNTLEYIPPGILKIGDGKRGDIGNTAEKYASAFFDFYGFDAVTLNPYMGIDSIEPFLKRPDKLSYILALTSNKSSGDFEKLRLEGGKMLFQEVIDKVHVWNNKNNCGIVFGATNLSELEKNLDLIGNLPLLIPGIGAQGGDIKNTVGILKRRSTGNYLLNISRALIYISEEKDFGTVITDEMKRLTGITGS